MSLVPEDNSRRVIAVEGGDMELARMLLLRFTGSSGFSFPLPVTRLLENELYEETVAGGIDDS